MNSEIRVSDRLSSKDECAMTQHKKSVWTKTEVLCGPGEIIYNPYGKSSFAPGCPFTKSTNMVVLPGAQRVLENTFGVSGNQITIPTLYEMDGIGSMPDSGTPTESYLTPDGAHGIVYRYGNFCQLFAVGITGTAENDISVYPVSYNEKDITLSKVNSDGLTVTGTLIPFRFTAETLSELDRKKYFGKKVNDAGITSYYYKKFETTPVIKHIWKTGEDVEEETMVDPGDVWSNEAGLNSIETFTEIILKINKQDIKEWFINLEQEDRTRINTIALLTGEYVDDTESGTPQPYGDYRDVRLFSKLCIPIEYLTLAKELNILYRVYAM
jgi:hypothetical protein